MSQPNEPSNNRRLVGFSLLARILTDTVVQMFYAFLPILAAGIGVTPVVFGRLISVRTSSGVLTPIFGNLAERRGYRTTLPLILFCGGIGAILLTISNNMLILVPAVFIMGIGVTNFQPLLAAYTSEALPPGQRARGMGIIEYGWALSSIIGVYIVGQMLQIGGWRIPLLTIGGGLCVMAIIFARLLRNRPDLDDTPPISLREQMTITENRSGAWASIAMQMLITFAGLHFFISYSIWLVDQFGFGAVQLASVVLAFGFVDLAGSGLVSIILDYLGRRASLFAGSIGAGVIFLLLSFLGHSGVVVAIAILLIGRFFFEFTIVANLISASEQAPTQRSRVMSMLGFLTTISGALAGLTGPTAVETWGLAGLGIPTAAGFFISAVLAWRYVRPLP